MKILICFWTISLLALPSVSIYSSAEASDDVQGEEKLTAWEPSDTPSGLCDIPVGEPDPNNPDESQDWTGAIYAPGRGAKILESQCGSMYVSGYALVRYQDQVDDDKEFTDHNGQERPVDGRQDLQFHRIMMWFSGNMFSKKLSYNFNFWSVYSTTQVAIIGNLSYKFNRHFNLAGGVAGLPGVRSYNSQHPYFLGTDRQLGENFFQSGFTNGVWATGEIAPKLKYRFMVGNSISQIGITAQELTRNFSYGATLWWQPTTGEFGARNGYGDFEYHNRLATQFGWSAVTARPNRFNSVDETNPRNTTVVLSDSTKLFETGALGEGVTVREADYLSSAFDAGFKYQGFFFFAETYWRQLNNFSALGDPNIDTITDTGAMVQASYYFKPYYWEGYTSGTKIWGEYNEADEIAFGLNHYPFGHRNFRINGLVNFVTNSPVSSVFGYYVGGQTGQSYILSTDIFF